MPAVSNQVIVRNNMGRFIADCQGAAAKTVMEVATRGANVSRVLAPKRTGKLSASIQPYLVSRTSAVWGSNLPYAIYQEKGTGPHPLPGWVTFWWAKRGRPWYPYGSRAAWENLGSAGAKIINHPGNPATKYLENGFDAVKGRLLAIADKHYPG